MNKKERARLAGLIDHTLLRPDAGKDEILRLCDEAMGYGFHSVCVHPVFVEIASARLGNSPVRVTTVIGFPLGMTYSRVKVYEAMEAVFCGAHELDMVVNLGALKAQNWKDVEGEIGEVCIATPGSVHKIIIETCYLTDDEMKKVCLIALDAGAEFVKTSTGFGRGGATVRDVEIMQSVIKGRIGLKAAGGIKTLNEVLALCEAGATRIGTSSGIAIMHEAAAGR